MLLHTITLEQAHNIATEVEHNILQDFPDADITLHMEPDVADTFKDITFVDQHFCTVPRGFYQQSSDAQPSDAQSADAYHAADAQGQEAASEGKDSEAQRV